MDHQARGDRRHPRLCTRTAGGEHGLDKAAAWQDRSQLTLWCEHADQPHPWPPSGAATDNRTSRHNDEALSTTHAKTTDILSYPSQQLSLPRLQGEGNDATNAAR
jgi:hypothetical protein